VSVFDEAKIDCHNHVFDPVRFPYAPGAHYEPAGAEIGTASHLMAVFDAFGVVNALVVGPNSGYGDDNRCLLDVLAQGAGRFRGAAVVPVSASLAELAQLRAAGVVAVTYNAALLGVDHYRDAGPQLADLAELGMFVDVQVEGDQLVPMLALLNGCDTRILVDHCGRPDPDAGIGQAGFQALLWLAAGGRTTVKLSGLMKCSRLGFPYTDAHPYVAALLETFGPEGCVWGSDWPFLRAPERIDYGPLLRLFEQLIPDPGVRRAVFRDTPAELFGFGV
jgi:predicted TIM-barrel fold metal-dependent hydrolase